MPYVFPLVRAAGFCVLLLFCGSGCKPKDRTSPPVPTPNSAGAPSPEVMCTAIRFAAADAGADLAASALACEASGITKVRVSARERAQLKVTTNAGAVAPTSSVAGEAFVTEIEVPSDASFLDVHASESSAALRIELVRVAPRPWLEEARTLRDRGALDDAARVITPRATDPAADATTRALASSLLGRIALAQGRTDEAKAMLRASVAAHQAIGRVSDAVDDALALAFLLVQRSHDYAEARAVLDAIEPWAMRIPEGRARLPYYRGVLASELGDHRRALALWDEASPLANALGLVRLARNSASARAVELQALGRFDEAAATLVELERSADGAGASPCERAELAINVAYVRLREVEIALSAGSRFDAGATDGARRLDDALGVLHHATSLFGDGRCSDPHLKALAWANLARGEYRARRFEQARTALATARAAIAAPRGTEALAWLELQGLLELEEGGAGVAVARAIFERERAEARMLQLREAEWSSLVALAGTMVLGRQRHVNEAIARLEEAETLLDEIALFAPLGSGRDSVLRDRDESAARLIDLHLQSAQPDAALRAARRARVRLLASVRAALRAERLGPVERSKRDHAFEAYRAVREEAERSRSEDWARSAASLAAMEATRAVRERRMNAAVDEAMSALGIPRSPSLPPLTGTATTLFMHHAHDHTWLFLVRPGPGEEAHRTEAWPIAPSDASAMAIDAALTERLDVMLRPGDVLRVLSDPSDHDLGALPFRGGGTLGERVVIAHSLDVGALRHEDRRAEPARSLVVGDSLSDLPAAATEADSVVRALGGGAPIVALKGDEATAPRLRAEMEHATFFHFAGHAVFAGHEGWDSHLRTAGGGLLSVTDLLTLPTVPSVVVLSSCESARTAGSSGDAVGATSAGGFGLAQAFVVAGSDLVIAPVRPVRDASIASLGVAIATALARADMPKERALMTALAATKSAVSDRDRWAFRLLTP